jgi:hypothetical protein
VQAGQFAPLEGELEVSADAPQLGAAGPRAGGPPACGPHACGPRAEPTGGAKPRSGEENRYRHETLAVVFQVRDRELQPGGPLGANERLGTSLGRHLAVKVDLTNIAHLEQLETRSDPQRDPRGRELATAYLALVTTDVNPRVPADTAWHPVNSLPPTAFDHESIIRSARERLRAKLSYTNIGFALTPATFTITELREIYAAALGHPVAPTNLQRILVRRGVIVATSDTVRPTPAGGRPATLYRFASRTLRVTNPFAAFRPPPTT